MHFTTAFDRNEMPDFPAEQPGPALADDTTTFDLADLWRDLGGSD